MAGRRQIDADRVFRVVETFEYVPGSGSTIRNVYGPYLKIGAAKGVRTNQIHAYNMWHDPNNPKTIGGMGGSRKPVPAWYNYSCTIQESDPIIWRTLHV